MITLRVGLTGTMDPLGSGGFVASGKYRQLHVWQHGIELVRRSYEITKDFPRHELYGLVKQIRDAAVSVPANVAEGYGRVGRGDYIHYVGISRASLFELDTHFEIALTLEYITPAVADELRTAIDTLAAMLTRLRARLADGRRPSL
jgi:four helix bundle protein